MTRTDAHIKARLIAENKGISFDSFIRNALKDKAFINPANKKSYSFSWVIDRLKQNDMKIVSKLEDV